MSMAPHLEPSVDERDERRSYERWAAVRRTEVRLVFAVFALLVVLTGYFAVLNVYVLLGAAPNPYTLRFEVPTGTEESATYGVHVEWDETGLREPVHRPRLLLNGRFPLPNHPESGSPPTVALGGVHTIEIQVPPGTDSAVHRGKLVLERVAGSTAFPGRLDSPVVVGVSGSVWQNWFVLRDWILMMLALGGFLYILCLLAFPAPSGSLLFQDDLSPSRVPVAVVPLRTRNLAWFAPWKRSSISIRWIWKRARIQLPLQIQGEMMFLTRSIPVLVVHAARRGVIFEKGHGGDRDPLECEGAQPCDAIDVMFEQGCYSYADPSDGTRILFSYRRQS